LLSDINTLNISQYKNELYGFSNKLTENIEGIRDLIKIKPMDLGPGMSEILDIYSETLKIVKSDIE
jgi:hypothetical protein